MTVLMKVVLVVQLLSALAMIGLILLQHGKGADAGAAFGGGAGSATLFGASGGANFLSRSTGALATVFLTSTLVLAYFGNYQPAAASGSSVLEGSATSNTPTAPAVGGTTPASTSSSSEIPGK
jgi:preprotein translocase subunit SecG